MMDYIAESIALGVDILVLGICYKVYQGESQGLEAIKNAPSLEIDSKLPQKVAEQPTSSFPFVSVRGTVKALGIALESQNSKSTKGVIQKLSLKEHAVIRGSAGFWSETKRIIKEIHNVVPFAIEGKQGKQIEVLDPLSASYLDMTTISDKFVPSKPGLLNSVWGFFVGVREKGYQDTEEMLTEGTLLTAVGELFSTQEGLKIQQPSNGLPYILTALPMTTLIKKIEDRVKMHRMFCLIFSGVGIAIAGAIAVKWWRDTERRRNDNKKRDDVVEGLRQRRKYGRPNPDDLKENEICVVCRSNPKEVILLNCGHVCVCEDCAPLISNTCPVCRSHVERVAAAYIS